MEANKGFLLNFRQFEIKKYSCLNEVMDLTSQIEEAMERNDPVSVRMLLAMRQEPIIRLAETQEAVSLHKEELSEDEKKYIDELVAEKSMPASEEEKMLVNQFLINRRLLERIIDADRKISLKLSGEKSYYCQQS